MRSTGEWGEFFDHRLSPYAYNETIAQEYFSLNPEIARRQGWGWYDDAVSPVTDSTIPLDIESYDEKKVGYETAQRNIDMLLRSAVCCTETGKYFKILPKELAFHIEHHLPLPTRHPSARRSDRMKKKNGRRLFDRVCSDCGKNIITTYAPSRPEKIVCEDCYRKLVY